MSETLLLSTYLPWHAEAWRRLDASSERRQIAHGLLIHAQGGMHKVHLGRQIAQGLLCTAATGAMACGHCRGCLLFASGNHPDWVEVRPTDSAFIKIDQIRELSARLSMRPQIAHRQVALLWPAEQMNVAAANALLKTLEEPAEDTHLLLLADRIGRLPATIRSRCQRLPLVTRVDAALVDAVAVMAKVDADRAQAALAFSGGDPESALEILQAEMWSELATVMQNLTDLALQRGDATAFVMTYRSQCAKLLHYWSRLIALAVQGERVGSAAFDAWIALTSRLEMSTLLPLSTQLERARGLAGSGVRDDLLVYDLAAGWTDAFIARGRRRGS